MNQLGLIHVGSRCVSRLNTGDQMRISSVTRFAQMHFVSIPGKATFSSNMSLWIVRRAQGQVCGGKHICVSLTELTIFPEKVLDPHLSQYLHLSYGSQQRVGILLIEHRQRL